ncbi:hypothetical protein B0H65DRAFT_459793 [Neurospora tetraspora]|uniref:Uncharacterized protein n=1 Tax=Neurospora tetraspora TaxID=94610 RepID=A0AAE0JLV2_9PEZI|nr:hypothetical protein B0H65DRAFT_459793 [Neurospora tetraspora]
MMSTAVAFAPGVAAKCGSALFCFLRSSALWIVVLVVLVFGGLRRRLFVARPPSPRPGRPAYRPPRRRSPPPTGPPSESSPTVHPSPPVTTNPVLNLSPG